MEKDWTNIEYLLNGNVKQQQSYNILMNANILRILKEYSPILVGTIPLEIDIEKSDLDIICEVHNFYEFEKLIKNSFQKYENFNINKINENQAIVANFFIKEFEIEIYGQAIPTKEQYGYRHMIIEDKILKLGGNKLKKEIINLKRNGMKTEPAFAKYLNLNGNPYEELLKLENMSNGDIELLLS
ncbi:MULTISPECIES: DUF4269 domain-containing protein [unclassified Clostridium]|uniref:DUF4269 domain-containing protein n=1 Tax=unclassified Clostridium TaxID=2614128 RepID=UPI0025BD3505|nr:MULTISPECIES: DUF4269 domain-containing protein [unclassified Clostridium]